MGLSIQSCTTTTTADIQTSVPDTCASSPLTSGLAFLAQTALGHLGSLFLAQNDGQQKAQEDAKREAEECRQMMLAQILSSEARERQKVPEERLIALLEQINTHTS
uniref:Uncharacterized protein n=1 Tax=Oryza punctata TaxID=4537 RepID=A0A0E0JIW5_ORYPU